MNDALRIFMESNVGGFIGDRHGEQKFVNLIEDNFPDDQYKEEDVRNFFRKEVEYIENQVENVKVNFSEKENEVEVEKEFNFEGMDVLREQFEKVFPERKSEFFEIFRQFQNTGYEIMERKNHDYAGTESPFKNFEMVEKVGVCSVEQGFLVRMMDKMQRISTLLGKDAQVKEESIEDTLIDLSNYAILLATYRKLNKGVK